MMARKFRHAFLEALERSGASIADVSRATGVSAQQLYKLRGRETASTNVDDATKIAAFFGMSLGVFMDEDQASIRSEIATLHKRISELESQRSDK